MYYSNIYFLHFIILNYIFQIVKKYIFILHIIILLFEKINNIIYILFCYKLFYSYK